jgi:hypothetical protein
MSFDDILTDSRRKVQHAIANNLVIDIHPLDMAELLTDLSTVDTIDIIKTCSIDNETGQPAQHVVIGDKVYFQTTRVPRLPGAHDIQ